MRTTVTALCALLLAAPAWAQQRDVFRNDAPETSITDTEQPPRSTSRSEGVNVGQEQGTDLPMQVQQSLTALSRNAVAAQQFGNLAASKQAPANIRDLADRMIATNSEINMRLDGLAARHNLQLPQRMPDADQSYFETLSETNQDEFARGLIAWVNQTYPTTIRALESVSDQEGFRDLAQATIPALRDQLRQSQQLAQDFRQGGPMQARMPGEDSRPSGR